MRRLIVLAVLAACCAAIAAEQKPAYTVTPVPYDPRVRVQALTPNQVFDKVKDSVVVVKTLDAQGKIIGQGSGVMLPSGKIGTNCHVLKNGTRFQVGGGKHLVPAILWGSNEDKDICLLEARGLAAKPAQLGQASYLKVGDPVYAVGAPQGLELSLSNGIVSQLRGGPPPFIQTTAAISPGSSGGGLFDAGGRLVGFTTLYIDGGQNLNFAMPVEWVEELQPGMKAAQGRSEVDWNKRASALFSAVNWTGMREWCEQWTRAQPGNSEAWFLLGVAHTNLQRYSEAIEAYRQSVRIIPENEAAWFYLGSAYSNLQRYTEAIEAYRQSVRVNPNNVGAWYDIGIAYGNLQRYAEEIEAYRQVLRISSEWDNAWNNLGTAYGNLQRHTEAIEAYRQAVRINPKNANAWNNLAISYNRSGNRIAALKAVQQLRRLDPGRADELFNLIVPR